MPARRPVTLSGLARASAVIIAVFAVSGRLLPFWPFELASHFPLHFAAALLLLSGLMAWKRDWRFLPGPLALAFVLATFGAPSWGREPAPDEATFSVVSQNVYFKSQRYADAAAFFLGSKAEVIVLVEATPEWVDQLAILRTRFPNVVTEQRDGSNGIVLMSKLPILEHDTIDLTGGGRVTLRATLRTSAGPVTLVAFHPPPPTTPGRAKRRNEEMREVAKLMRTIEGPRILIGDFNCSPWSRAFRRLKRDSGLADSRDGWGLQSTWPSHLGPVGIPIDHALVTKDLRVVDREIGPRIGSDHLGIVVRLAVDAPSQ